jgi:hypothetical protein
MGGTPPIVGFINPGLTLHHLGMGQNLVPLRCSHQTSWVKMDVNNPLKMVCIGIDPYPHGLQVTNSQ